MLLEQSYSNPQVADHWLRRALLFSRLLYPILVKTVTARRRASMTQELNQQVVRASKRLLVGIIVLEFGHDLHHNRCRFAEFGHFLEESCRRVGLE